MNANLDFASSPRVVAVVVTRNRPMLLKSAIDALKAQTIALQAIVVVDNASEPETVDLLRHDPSLTVLQMERNVGGSGGFAAGVDEALRLCADWVWLLDDDVVLKEDALENLLCPQGGINRNARDVGVLCPAVEESGTLALMHRRYFDPATLREMAVPRRKYSDPAVEIDTASFVGFLVKAEAIRKVGLPDSRFFVSYDDTEFSLRLKQAGYRLWLLPASRADHRRLTKARLRRGPFGLKHYYNLRNRLIVYRKFGRAPAWRWWLPLAQGVLLLLVASRGQPTAFKWWWRAMRDSRAEPQVVAEIPMGAGVRPAPAPFKQHRPEW